MMWAIGYMIYGCGRELKHTQAANDNKFTYCHIFVAAPLKLHHVICITMLNHHNFTFSTMTSHFGIYLGTLFIFLQNLYVD